jgi:hypothetical protein
VAPAVENPNSSFQKPLCGDNDESVDVGNDVGQTGFRNSGECAEPKLNPDGIGGNGTKAEKEREKSERYSDASDDAQHEPHRPDAQAGRSGPGRTNDLHAEFRLWDRPTGAASFSRLRPRV